MGSEIHIKIKLKVIGKPKWRYRITEWILLLKNLPSHITKGSEVKIQGEIEKNKKTVILQFRINQKSKIEGEIMNV